MISVLVGVATEKHLKILSDETYSPMETIKFYTQLQLVLTITRKVVSQITLDMVLMSQFGLCALLWFLVNCFDILPGAMLIFAVACIVVVLSMAILLLCLGIDGRVHSQRLICKFVAKYTGSHTSRAFRYYSMKWKAQQPLPFYCGERFSLSEDAIMNYLAVLCDNASTIILLYHP